MGFSTGGPFIFVIEYWLTTATSLILLGVKAFAFVTSLLPSGEEYDAAGKLSKLAWVVILGLGVLSQVVLLSFGPIHPIHLAFTVAALVFLADVRPAIASLKRG